MTSNPYVHPAAAADGHESNGAGPNANAAFSTMLMHADEPDIQRDPNHPIAPNVTLSTTFRTPHPTSSLAADPFAQWTYDNPQSHIYSRYTSEARGRAEQVLSKLMGGYAVTYASGLNAAYAVALHVQPTTIALRRGYFGCHESFNIYAKTKGGVQFIDLDAEYPTDGTLLVWVETPLNPSGEARDIQHYADRAHKAGGKLAVDSTFAPPPLQNPFNQGADLVMHSATKYFGGHSDLLMGVVASRDAESAGKLWHDRTYIGSTPGNLESYLLLRSLRTLDVRVRKQSETATELARWLWSVCANNKQTSESALKGNPADVELYQLGIVGWVSHSSLQPRSVAEQDPSTGKRPEGVDFDPTKQMPGGFSPTFAIRVAGGIHNGGARAAWLPHQTQYWIPATSLGGVESLIEHRIDAEPTEDPGTIRLSVGLEDVEDLKDDLRRAFKKVLAVEEAGKLVWPGSQRVAKALGKKEI